jgi:hypothetical protein
MANYRAIESVTVRKNAKVTVETRLSQVQQEIVQRGIVKILPHQI